MSIHINVDTGATSQEELAALGVFLATIAPTQLKAVDLREHQRTLYGGSALSGGPVATREPQPAVRNENVAIGAEQFTDAEVAGNAPTAVRERGKPSQGRARRTKEEIAEDEAADAADAASSETKANISTGEERIDPADVAAQDKADEAAEVETHRDAEKPLTVDDVKAAVNAYVGKYGLPATQEDGPKIFVEALGKPPEGEAYWKLSLLSDATQEQLQKAVSTWAKATELNPLKRNEV